MTDTCYLCLEPLTSNFITTGCNCNSKLHKKCFKMLVETQDNNLTCSICKNDFSCNPFTKCFNQTELFSIMTNKKQNIPEDCILLDKHVNISFSNMCRCCGNVDLNIKTNKMFANMLLKNYKIRINVDKRNNNISVYSYCKKTDYYNYLNALSSFVNQSKSETRSLKNKKYTKNTNKQHFQIKSNRICTHYRR